MTGQFYHINNLRIFPLFVKIKTILFRVNFNKETVARSKKLPTPSRSAVSHGWVNDYCFFKFIANAYRMLFFFNYRQKSDLVIIIFCVLR